MKTVNDIIWSDIIDDDTEIIIFDQRGVRLTSSYCIVHRFYEDVSKWGQYYVDLIRYRPIHNILLIYIYFVTEVENDTP